MGKTRKLHDIMKLWCKMREERSSNLYGNMKEKNAKLNLLFRGKSIDRRNQT